METSKQPTQPSQQQMCCNKHCSTRVVRAQGSTWNAWQQSLMDSNAPVPGTWQGAMARAFKGTNFVGSFSTLPALTHNSLNSSRKLQGFLVKADLMQREMPQAIFLQAFAYGKKRSMNKSRAQDAKGKLNPCKLLITYTILDLAK